MIHDDKRNSMMRKLKLIVAFFQGDSQRRFSQAVFDGEKRDDVAIKTTTKAVK
jgi:hypothetical protein